LVVRSTKPRLPEGKEDWCREQIQAAIDLDWSPWLPDGEPVTLAEIIQESRSYHEGATSQVTQEIKARCDALRKKTKELLRDADGLLRCKVCDWHKPEDEMISGDIVELHHLDPISEAPDEGRIVTITDAVKLFVPVCPNCHRMIHARTGGGHFDIETLRAILKKQQSPK
jgi:predicted HNH restriction endonuclease